MEQTVFDVPKMDCPSEERLIRMALQSAPVERLDFDLKQRRLTALHGTTADELLRLLEPLKFGAKVVQSGPASPAAPGEATRTTFDIPKMDCPSEERLIRMALQSEPIQSFEFDLGQRRLTAVHTSSADRLLKLLEPLNFGARVAESVVAPVQNLAARPAAAQADPASERSTLMVLLAINAVMFLVEFIAGWTAQSTGLIADSLDMFADAAVYGVSLYAVGKAATSQASAARLSGYLQLLLAAGALAEVIRRFVVGSEPEPPTMMTISALALVANLACMALISKHREGGVHMRASWIFSTNDVIANLGVIAAGALVAWTGSHVPDLVVGTIIAAVVFSGALRILRISKPTAGK